MDYWSGAGPGEYVGSVDSVQNSGEAGCPVRTVVFARGLINFRVGIIRVIGVIGKAVFLGRFISY